MHYLDESHILLFLVQVFVLLACARGLGELLGRWRQPALTGELLVGVVLGPTVLGRFFPQVRAALFPADPVQQAMLETVAWLGVLLLLLDTGLEIDFSIAWRQRGSALIIAIADILIPMAIAFAAAVLLPARYMVDPQRRIVFALFMATVMTISAMPVAARILRDVKLLKADLGLLVMSALTVNDIVGWVVFTVILGVFSTASASWGPVALVFAVTVGFAALALSLGRRLSSAGFAALHRMGLPEPGTSLTATVLLGLLFGALTQKLGIHALFGFFVAGVVAGEAKTLAEQTRCVVSQMVHSLFVPLFFASIGLKIDFAADFDLPLVALMCGVGIGSRYLGAWIGAALTDVPHMNRTLIAIAHTPGGMMEIVVALLALEAGLINNSVFVAIVFSAVFSSMAMGPWMTAALARRRGMAPGRFLVADAVVPRLAATTPTDAIHELANRLAQHGGAVAVEALVRQAAAREQEFSTAIGQGVATPHARLAGLASPLIAYGRSVGGIHWDAPDGDAVEHVFLLAIPGGAEDVHIQVLSAIASAMASPASRRRLRDAEDAGALSGILRDLLGQPGGAA